MISAAIGAETATPTCTQVIVWGQSRAVMTARAAMSVIATASASSVIMMRSPLLGGGGKFPSCPYTWSYVAEATNHPSSNPRQNVIQITRLWWGISVRERHISRQRMLIGDREGAPMTTISGVDEADDGDQRWPVSRDDATEPFMMTVGEEEVVDQHLDDAEAAMMINLDADLLAPEEPLAGEWTSELISAENDELDDAESREDDAACDPLGAEERWRQHLVLYENAKAASFRGPPVEKWWAALIEYAVGVLKGKIYTGEIYGMVKKRDHRRKRRWGVSPTQAQQAVLRYVPQEREQLAVDVVLDACELWMAYEKKGRGYDPALGKTCESFLVELCKDTFPNAFRRWQTAHNARAAEITESDLGVSLAELRGAGAQQRLDDEAARADAIDRVWKVLRNERERVIVSMQFAGYSHKEIGDALKMTPKAVSRALERITQREGKRR